MKLAGNLFYPESCINFINIVFITSYFKENNRIYHYNILTYKKSY